MKLGKIAVVIAALTLTLASLRGATVGNLKVETIPSALPDQIVPAIPERSWTASNIPVTSKKKSTTVRKGSSHSGPRRRVVKEGGTEESEVQLSERMPSEVASHRRASTTTLLSSTEENLKRISGQTLTADQQATVSQIRLFMQQSRDAIQQSDVDRAHTLALKAHLLSDSLMKP